MRRCVESGTPARSREQAPLLDLATIDSAEGQRRLLEKPVTVYSHCSASIGSTFDALQGDESNHGETLLSKSKNSADTFCQAIPLLLLFTQTFLTASCEAVNPCAPIIRRDLPFSGDPTGLLHAVKGRIQRDPSSTRNMSPDACCTYVAMP